MSQFHAPFALSPGKQPRSTVWIWGWWAPQTNRNAVKKKKIPSFFQETNLSRPARSLANIPAELPLCTWQWCSYWLGSVLNLYVVLSSLWLGSDATHSRQRGRARPIAAVVMATSSLEARRIAILLLSEWTQPTGSLSLSLSLSPLTLS